MANANSTQHGNTMEAGVELAGLLLRYRTV